MSEIKALEKLRKLTICDEGEKYTAYLDAGYIADEIEAEIAERYTPLPVDEDGKIIRVGDEVQGFGDSGPVQHLELWDGEWVVVFEYSAGQFTRYSGDAVHHVKPRTLEDVLCDALADVSCAGDGIRRKFEPNEPYVTRLADEIRAMFGEVDGCKSIS